MERQSILVGRHADIMKDNFFDLWTLSVIQNAKKDAIIFNNGSDVINVSYQTMEKLSNQIARLLLYQSENNPRRTEKILISAKYSEKLPIILLAILKAGMTYVPIEHEFSVHRKQYILEEVDPCLVIHDEEIEDIEIYSDFQNIKINQMFTECIAYSDLEISERRFSDIPVILYTSGSTGVPKGVQVIFSALINRLIWQWRELPYKDEEHYCIVKSALTFIDSVYEIWSPLLQGLTVVIVPKNIIKNPEMFLPILEEYQIYRIILVPSHLNSILSFIRCQGTKYAVDSLKLWVSTGEALKPTIVNEFFSVFGYDRKILANFYGCTELTGDVAYYLYQQSNKKDIESQKMPIGIPVYNTVIYIVNDSMQIVPQGETGELWVSGLSLAHNYLRNSDLNKFIENPFSKDPEHQKVYRTGDFAQIVDDLLIFKGRRDQEIKIRGHKVNLSEIERAVTLIPEVCDAAAVFQADQKNDSADIVCFIVPITNNCRLSFAALERKFSNILAPDMIPKIILIDRLPLLNNGKVDRQNLMKLLKSSKYSRQHIHSCNYIGVPNAYFEKARILFETLLDVISLRSPEIINVESNFYKLGGNSLNSVYTVVKLQEQGYSISLSNFINAKNLGDIIEKMEIYKPIILCEGMEDDHANFVCEMINDSHKHSVCTIVADCQMNKGELERYLRAGLEKSDYIQMINDLWDCLINDQLSYVVKSISSEEILAVSLNFDARNKPHLLFKNKMMTLKYDFLEHVEKPILNEKLPKGKGMIFYESAMATHKKLTPAQNVILTHMIEHQSLKIAKARKFIGVFTLNSSPLTQQIAVNILNFEVLRDYQVNQYIYKDGTKPFEKAPDCLRIQCSWKELRKTNHNQVTM